jgi:hypothetical protein
MTLLGPNNSKPRHVRGFLFVKSENAPVGTTRINWHRSDCVDQAVDFVWKSLPIFVGAAEAY